MNQDSISSKNRYAVLQRTWTGAYGIPDYQWLSLTWKVVLENSYIAGRVSYQRYVLSNVKTLLFSSDRATSARAVELYSGTSHVILLPFSTYCTVYHMEKGVSVVVLCDYVSSRRLDHLIVYLEPCCVIFQFWLYHPAVYALISNSQFKEVSILLLFWHRIMQSHWWWYLDGMMIRWKLEYSDPIKTKVSVVHNRTICPRLDRYVPQMLIAICEEAGLYKVLIVVTFVKAWRPCLFSWSWRDVFALLRPSLVPFRFSDQSLLLLTLFYLKRDSLLGIRTNQ